MAWWERLSLGLILLLAAALRFAGLNWDGLQHHHPDERYITWVGTTIEAPSTWAGAFDPRQSTFNPFRWPPEADSEGIVVFQDQPRDFAYGHLPLYLGVLATRLAERLSIWLLPLLPPDWAFTRDVLNGAGRVEFHHMAVVGRGVAALADLLTVWLTYLLGRRLFGPIAGLLAGGLLALTVLHIQSAHFFISDPFMALFVVATLWLLVVALQSAVETGGQRRATRYLLLGAAAAGLAVGSKFTAVLLALPLVYAAWRTTDGTWRAAMGRAVLAGLVALAAFVLTNPFVLLDWTCGDAAAGTPALLNNCYLENILTQNRMVSGESDQGFVRQYDGTVPYLYYIEMGLRWGMGPLLGAAAFAGLGWGLWHVGRGLRRRGHTDRRLDGLLLVLLWLVAYFALTGALHAKFMRYLLPMTPLLMVLGASLLVAIPARWLRTSAIVAVVLSAAVYAVAFSGIYRQPHPWNEASAWIHRNVTPGALILSEQWDDYLPVTMEVDGRTRRRSDFRNAELTWLSGADAADNSDKLLANLALLAEAEYVTVLSNRVYGVVPRLDERYPLSGQYHQLLFDGALGYELVWVGGRFPGVGGFALKPDSFGWPGLRPPAAAAAYLGSLPGISLGRADESFTVYDQPLTMIFRNVERLSVQQLRAQFSE